MTEFTKEEISLCKQVTKRYRKEIKKGDWYNDLNVVGGNLDLCDCNAGFHYRYLNGNEKVIPLWTISNCLEWLYEKYEEVGVDSEENKTEKYWEASVYLRREGNEDLSLMTAKGKTPLEALLKIVLAVLEEKRK